MPVYQLRSELQEKQFPLLPHRARGFESQTRSVSFLTGPRSRKLHGYTRELGWIHEDGFKKEGQGDKSMQAPDKNQGTLLGVEPPSLATPADTI